MVLTLAGWLVTLAFAEIAVSAAARMALIRLRPSYPAARFTPTALGYSGALAASLAAIGVIGALPGALLAVALAAAAAWQLGGPVVKAARRGRGRTVGMRVLRAQAGIGPALLRDDLQALLGLLRRGDPEAPPAPVAPAAEPPAGREAPAPRAVPSVREDPVLGEAPAPEAVAAGLASAGVPVPPAWAALCDATASFEPDTDEDLLAHVAGEAAGILAYSEAARARAEALLHGTGLDPAYVAGHHEFADQASELAAAIAMVDRRFHVIYGTVREWVARGGILPHNARQFLGGGDAAPQAGAGEEAA